MNILIAGGTGFVGRHLIKRWLASDYDITVLGRSASKILRIYADTVQTLTWDELKQQGPEAIRSFDIIINLTGATIGTQRWSKARKQEILDSRIQSTQLLSEYCAKLGVESPDLFNTSAIGVYGLQEEKPDGLPDALDESTPIDFSQSTDFLSEVGHAWEQATEAAVTGKCRVVIMRFGVVLAADGGALEAIATPFKFFIGGPIASGQQPFSWISIDDLARAIEFLWPLKEVMGPINLVAPGCVTQRQFAQALGKALQRPSVMPTPGFMLRLVFGQMADELLLKGQHVAPTRLTELGFVFKYPTIDKALTHFFA